MDQLPVQYQDFPQNGLVLITPSFPNYESLVTQIKARSLQPEAGQTTPDDAAQPEDIGKSVIFFNKSEKPVLLLQVLWRYAFPDGREIAGSCGWGGNERLLLPFGLPPDMKAMVKYESAILPGSKRYISNNGEVFGDNTDVRPPYVEETWKGGMVRGFGGTSSTFRNPTQLSIAIEGSFFDDGEFVGANRTKLFEKTVAKANARAKIIKIAGKSSLSAGSILDEIQASASRVKTAVRPRLLPDPSTPMSAYDDWALRELAMNLERQRAFKGEAATLDEIRSWATTQLPTFRKAP